MSLHPYRYEELTWLEIKDAVAAKKAVLLPFGAVEDHGHHSPLNTDNIIGTSICREAGRRAPQEMLILPTIPYGLDEHHMDFPGTITVEMNTLINFVADVCISVARAGFTHVLIVNWDWPEPSAYAWQDWWSRFSATGTYGDPTVATKEFGELLFETSVTRLIELVKEFKTIQIKPRVDHH